MEDDNSTSSVLSDFDRLLSALKSRGTFAFWLECIIWTIIEIIILVGNTITLKIIICSPTLRTIPNFLIASLAISDIGLGLFSGPLCLGVLVVSEWPFSNFICQFHGMAALTFACTSVENLALMAVNRYFRVVKPNKYRKYFKKGKTLCYICIVWMSSLIASMSYIPSGPHGYVFHPGKFFCYLHIDDYVFLLLTVTFYIAFPAMLIAFCYYKVYKTIQKHNRSMSNWGSSSQRLSVQEINITRTLFLILVMFMVCWLPVFTMDIIDIIKSRWSLPREAYVAYTFLAASSSSINPVLYGIMNPAFRKEYLKTLTCGLQWTRKIKVSPADPVNKGANSNTKSIQLKDIARTNK